MVDTRLSRSRLAPVEKEILRCVAAGETADFSAWSSGGKPRVQAEFLRDLWLGLDPQRTIHPRGICLRNLRIVGILDIEGVAGTGVSGDRLCAFSAIDCEFEGPIILARASIQGLHLERCLLEGRDSGGTPEPYALAGEGVDIAGACWLSEIEPGCRMDLANARIGNGLNVQDCSGLGELRLEAVRIEGSAYVGRCGFVGSPFISVLVNAVFARISGGLIFDRCACAGVIDLSNTSAATLFIKRSRMGTLRIDNARVLSEISIMRTLVLGQVSLVNVNIGGILVIRELFVHQCGDVPPGLFLMSGVVAAYLLIERSRIDGSIDMRALRASMEARLIDSKIVGSARAGLDLSSSCTGKLTLENLRLDGWINLTNCRITGDLSMTGLKIGARAGDPPPPVAAAPHGPEALQTADPTPPKPPIEAGFDAIVANNADIAGDVVILGCAISGTVFGNGLKVGRSLGFSECWIDGGPNAWSLALNGVDCGLIFVLSRCLIVTGASFPVAKCSELQIQGCTITCPRNPTFSGTAIWAGETSVERAVLFRAAAPKGPGESPVLNRLSGRVDFGNSAIGQDFKLASTIVTLPRGPMHGRLGIALSLNGASIGGDCLLADRNFDQTDWTDHQDRPAEVEGCIQLDDATITGDVAVHRTVITADGQVRRPGRSYASEERVSKRKRGVALSLRDTKVAGALELGKPAIAGLVDLRGAAVGLLADGGGARWRLAGLAPGRLLLDGLSYRRLDETDDEEERPGAIVGNVSVAAERRLCWLRLQFPDECANADSFVPQPYEQLARVFSEQGNERARRRILVAKRDMQRKYGRLGRFDRGISWVLKATSDYGYSPLRALFTLMLFILVGVLCAVWVDGHHALVRASKDSATANPLNPIVYAIDLALPIIDLRQDSVFTIDATRLPAPWNSAAVVTLARAFYEIVGLILVSVTVLTLTGTLREKD